MRPADGARDGVAPVADRDQADLPIAPIQGGPERRACLLTRRPTHAWAQPAPAAYTLRRGKGHTVTESRTNWAGNITYRAAALHSPTTVEQVQELVRHADTLKALGSRHSFDAIADTRGEQLTLERFDHTVAVDRARRTATVDGGARYGDLAIQLHRAGYALHNMASLPHISVAGACATATHGSGDRHGNLATAVAALEFVTADGTVVSLSSDRDADRFPGAVVGLGGLGVVTSLTLAVEPTFEVRQDIYEHLPLAHLEAHFDDIMSRAYSVSLFTDWQGETIDQVWLKSRVTGGIAPEPPAELFGSTRARAPLHPIRALSAESCTEQMGVPGPWHERLPHFKMEFTPSSGEELQSEYFVPRRHAVAAIRAIHRLRGDIAHVLQISELRTVAADTLWLSPCYRRDSLGLHFTWRQDWAAVRDVLPSIEAALAPFEARPHWGKLFTLPPARLQPLYAKLPDFRELLRAYDPRGKFRNEFLDTYIFEAA